MTANWFEDMSAMLETFGATTDELAAPKRAANNVDPDLPCIRCNERSALNEEVFYCRDCATVEITKLLSEISADTLEVGVLSMAIFAHDNPPF